MTDVRALVGARPTGQRHQQIVYGTVSVEQPAPSSFTAPLYVVLPSHNPDGAIAFASWPALHGSALPSPGAAVVVGYDERRVPQVIWWDGAAAFAPTGAAGGDLSGTYPNPTSAIATSCGAWHKVADENVSPNSGTWALTWDATDNDPLGLKTSNTAFTVPRTGLWALSATVYVQGSPGAYQLRWGDTTGREYVANGPTSSQWWQVTASGVAWVTAGTQLQTWMTTGNATYTVRGKTNDANNYAIVALALVGHA